jgi:hypothetical protein
MARKKSAKTARTSAARRIESLWQDARGAFRSAESQARKRVTAFARRNGVDTQELVERARQVRGRIERDGRKARKAALARLAQLQQRARDERRSLTRMADHAVARALAALDIPTRREVQELSRRVELLSTRVGALRR